MATKICPICDRPADRPFVQRDADGSIRFGCVAVHHDGRVDGDHAAHIARARAAGIDGKA
jgi:hypothetical protein